jgi:hypothetical protein
MIQYEVDPRGGIGGVRLGMTREESRAAMRWPTDVDSGPAADRYHDAALEVGFGEDGRVERIAIRPSARFTAIVGGLDLFRLPSALVEERLAAMGETAAEVTLQFAEPAAKRRYVRGLVIAQSGSAPASVAETAPANAAPSEPESAEAAPVEEPAAEEEPATPLRVIDTRRDASKEEAAEATAPARRKTAAKPRPRSRRPAEGAARK